MEIVEEGYSLEEHPTGQSRNLDAEVLRLDLAKELLEIQQGERWQSSGHNAKTLVKYSDLRVVLIAIKPGRRMGQHRTIGRLSLQVLTGSVRVHLGAQVLEVPQGGLVALGPSVPHDIEALTHSSVLLTLVWPNPGERVPPHA